MRRAFPVLAALAALALAVTCARGPSPLARSWWSHVEYLASDSLAGRNTGTAGYLRAAEYVAGQAESFGARPQGLNAEGAGAARFFQPVRFVSRQVREDQSSLEIVRGGAVERLDLGTDATLGMGIESADSLEAEMMFVGWGLSIPEEGYDDFAGVDLRGKIAVYFRGGPDTLPGPLRAHAQKTDIRWNALRQAGAVGVMSVSQPRFMDIPWERSTLRRLEPNMSLADSGMDQAEGMKLSVTINPAHAEKFFAGSGHTFAEMLALADSGSRLPSFPLAGKIRSKVRFTKTHVESPNVIAVIPGSDPMLEGEYVVLSAHLDHLGIGGAVAGDSIYNGAMDNASGVASLLEIARLAADSAGTFRRSVMLLAVTGEEQGLEGSRYFATHPTVPIQSIVANINLDMFLPIVPLERLVVYGLDESDLGDWVRPVADRFGVQVMADPEPQRNLFIRSDQYSFIRAGVPALSFKVGYAPGSKEEKTFKAWLHDRYHAPSDDLAQPVDREAAAEFTRLLYAFAHDVANRDAAPRWKETSFFKRFAPAPVAAR